MIPFFILEDSFKSCLCACHHLFSYTLKRCAWYPAHLAFPKLTGKRNDPPFFILGYSQDVHTHLYNLLCTNKQMSYEPVRWEGWGRTNNPACWLSHLVCVKLRLLWLTAHSSLSKWTASFSFKPIVLTWVWKRCLGPQLTTFPSQHGYRSSGALR